MSMSLTCPKCQARLKLGSPLQQERGFTCPKCGHLVKGPALQKSSTSYGLIFGLGAGVLLLGGGILFVLLRSGGSAPDKGLPAQTDAQTKLKKELDAQENQKKLEEEFAKKTDEEKKRKDYMHWMIEGGTKAGAQKWSEALTAYQEALRALPDDPQAKQRLQEAQVALEVQAKVKANDEKALTDLKKLVEQAQEALASKQYAAAAEIFKLVLQRNPGETAASQGLIAAQEGLAQDQQERKKQEDFQKHLAAGQAALKAKRYTDAIAEFVAAQVVLPKNAQALQLQKQAEKLLGAEANQKDQKAEFIRLVDMGAASLKNQRFEDAVDSYKRALILVPNDPTATRGLDDARKALKTAGAQFDTLIARGNNAMRDARFRDAIDAYKEATRLMPDNNNAAKALAIAEAAFENRATYISAMKRGNFALRNQIYDEAVLGFTEALKVVPNDTLAGLGLIEAQKGLNDYLRRRADADKLLQIAALAAKQRNHPEAAKAYRDALKVLPTHPQVLAIERQMRYHDAMADGNAALNAKRFPDAIRSFQLALQEVPGDPQASAGLTRARALNKN